MTEMNSVTSLDTLLKKSSQDLEKALLEIITGLGFDKYAYYSAPENDLAHEPLIHSNYPTEWISHYVESNYGEIDPVHLASKKSLLPVEWGGEDYIKSLESQQKKLFDESEKFGINVGFTVPIHSPDGSFAALTLASKNKTTAFREKIQAHKTYLHLLAVYYHEAVSQTASQLTTNPLTKREQICLGFIAQGFSYACTADEMNITRNTVLYFAKNIRHKLNTTTIQHAVAIAVKRGLIVR